MSKQSEQILEDGLVKQLQELGMVWYILKQHGYNIDVRSIPDSETVFTLYF